MSVVPQKAVTRINLQKLSVADLVQRFEVAQLAQFNAERHSDIQKQNRCVRQAMAIADELKSRPGDQRSALLKLYEHSNVQVRLMAAKLTLAVAPSRRRPRVRLYKLLLTRKSIRRRWTPECACRRSTKVFSSRLSVEYPA